MLKRTCKRFAKLAVPLVLVGSLLFMPQLAIDAFAAGGGHDGHGHHAPGFGSLIYPFLNFFLYVAILVFAYKKAGKAKLVEKHTDVKDHLNRAAQDLSAAETSYATAQRRLAEIETEKAELVAALNQEGDQLAAAAIAKAEHAAENSRLDTQRRIRNEQARTEQELRREVVRQATALARSRAAAQMSTEDDARLRREALQRIGRGGA